MGDLFWPGAERAGGLLGDEAFLDALVAVEQAWLDALVGAGLAPEGTDLTGMLDAEDVVAVAAAAEAGGNPAQPVVTLLRERSGNAWVHRGLTSQDVVDTALALCLRDVRGRLREELRAQVVALVAQADAHRSTLMAARTLTQHAVPTTFGRKAAGWLDGVLAAAARVDDVALPAQLGGAAGTLSAVVELAGSPAAASALVRTATQRLGLEQRPPWHTSRGPVTAAGDALVACTDAWGRVATDVVTLARPEIGELAEPSPGGSSTMPHKQNPVLSVLIRRAALTTPGLAATLHTASALAGDERPDGAWHAEWATLRDLGRRTVVAASHATELLAGLSVDTERMAATTRAHWADLTAERDAIARFAGVEPSAGDYLGTTDTFIDAVLDRARTFLEEQQQ
ncbi:3-carboxy-cis,cis-muconate cycloisomerase [Nocardioides sp. LMS-CY]|uniref:lyase family protein n=1 Tax=Nocardioides sp. (strain LMS-CY) TaxID=2840457 RepID=UPI001C003916|nr:lyase family protein [Nocardioides sp. LMS-CY]QWF22324.1 3-carboxy-cis,cis-muconate cycloisomerase [Nocardioides sp. LMS-CY]